jgi:hypothetical protein
MIENAAPGSGQFQKWESPRENGKAERSIGFRAKVGVVFGSGPTATYIAIWLLSKTYRMFPRCLWYSCLFRTAP